MKATLSIGALLAFILAILAVFFLGNMTVNTTPATQAKGNYEYLVTSDKSCNSFSGEERDGCHTAFLNRTIQEGWEFVEWNGGSIATFRKEK